jgi:hypothetical protein
MNEEVKGKELVKVQSPEEKAVVLWDEVIEGLIELQNLWGAYHQNFPSVDLGKLPAKAQEHFNKGFNLGEFYISVPTLIEYAWARGGLEVLLVEKEKSDGRRKEGREKGRGQGSGYAKPKG